MPLNIETMSEEQLRELHRLVTERLRLLSQIRAHGAMMKFSIGDRVAFTADGRRIAGVLTRYNKKSVTVHTDCGGHWTVSPTLLEPGPAKRQETANGWTEQNRGQAPGDGAQWPQTSPSAEEPEIVMPRINQVQLLRIASQYDGRR